MRLVLGLYGGVCWTGSGFYLYTTKDGLIDWSVRLSKSVTSFVILSVLFTMFFGSCVHISAGVLYVSNGAGLPVVSCGVASCHVLLLSPVLSWPFTYIYRSYALQVARPYYRVTSPIVLSLSEAQRSVGNASHSALRLPSFPQGLFRTCWAASPTPGPYSWVEEEERK